VSAKAINNPPGLMLPTTTNSRAWRGAEIPAANGHATARALARIYGALARGGEIDGIRILGSRQIGRYVMNQMGPNASLLDPRTTVLINAVYASL
jgi:hypothetical protein